MKITLFVIEKNGSLKTGQELDLVHISNFPYELLWMMVKTEEKRKCLP